MLIGICGKANVGKSTFYKALTLADIGIANYPFTTIAPNRGAGHVKIECVENFFNAKCHPKQGFCVEHKRFIPVEIIDVAGLVPGAHEGKGMGNQFLDDLNQANALIHIIDVAGTTNERGEPVTIGSYDPTNDVKFLEIELDYWYLRILKKGWERFARQIQQEHSDLNKALAKQLSGLRVTEELVKSSIKKLDLNPETPTNWSEEELLSLSTELRKNTKPMIIAANKIDVPGAYENYLRLKDEFPEYNIVPCSAESELALKEAAKHGLIKYVPGENDFSILDEAKISEKQRKALEFIRKNMLEKYKTTGVQDILNKTVFNLLNCIVVYPVANSKLEDKDQNVLPDCFLVPNGITAGEFAFVIHTEIGKKFIRAVDLKTKQVIGREYKLKNQDVIEIITAK